MPPTPGDFTSPRFTEAEMPANPAPSGAVLSSLVLAEVAAACDRDAPHSSAASIADVLGADLAEVRRALAELIAADLVWPADAVVPRLLLGRHDVPVLDPAPARPTAEAQRHERDLDAYLEVVARWRAGWPVHAGQALPSEGGLLMGRARRDTLQRLRDPARPGGALCWPAGAYVATPAGRAALEKHDAA